METRRRGVKGGRKDDDPILLSKSGEVTPSHATASGFPLKVVFVVGNCVADPWTPIPFAKKGPNRLMSDSFWIFSSSFGRQ